MYDKCCVDNCQSKRKDVKLHQFPASEIGLQKWVQCINSDTLRNFSIQALRRVFVCHKHFERKFITEKSRIRLGAYPTLFSEEEIRSGLPTEAQEDENTENIKFDHCYTRRQHEDHTYCCKSGPSNIVSCDAAEDVITIRGINLSIIYDPPHLIKGIRNNFITKNIICDNKVSTWTDIVDAYKSDCKHAEMRFLHKLNDSHVIPEKISKMKVKNCTRVLSKTVASYLDHIADFSHYADGTPVSRTIKNTAETVLFFDKLFDSTNGATMLAKKTRGKDLKKAVNANSPHHKFWRESIVKLTKIKYIDEKRGEVSVPSLKNWIVTLKSYMRLWEFFSARNIKIMRPRYFNSDPIENFFGQVRAYNFRNTDPTCHTFQTTFKSLLITRFIKFHSTDFNCEEDSAEQLLKLKNLFKSQDAEAEPSVSTSYHNPWSGENNVDTENIEVLARREKFNIHSRAYTAGWLVRKIVEKIKCAECSSDLTTSEGSIHSWISRREYDSSIKKRLTYPSEYAVRSFGIIVNESNEYLEKTPQVNSITKKIKQHILSKYSFDYLKCESHKEVVLQYFLSVAIKLTVFNWCGIINKILRGTDISRLNKKLPLMQNRALEKYKKKLKNKNK